MRGARKSVTITTVRRGCVSAVVAMGLLVLAGAARAQIGSERYSSLVMRAEDGRIVMAVSPDEPRFPASLTKMMTLYMVFEALRDRRIDLRQVVPISVHAASMSPSKLGLVPGNRIDVQQLILGLVTKSANDGAAALGELLGGSEERFAQMMTLRARALGMSRTVFRNASGLPDADQVSTARDLAALARHLIEDYPDQYRYFSVPQFVFRGRVIPNHDRLLQSYPGADGIKTGYTEASGFNLVTSANRGDVRLIGVVLGAARPGERDQHMAALLDNAYQQLGVPIAPTRDAPGRLNLISNAQAAGFAPPVLPSGLVRSPPRKTFAKPPPQRPTKAQAKAPVKGAVKASANAQVKVSAKPGVGRAAKPAPAGKSVKAPVRGRAEAKRAGDKSG